MTKAQRHKPARRSARETLASVRKLAQGAVNHDISSEDAVAVIHEHVEAYCAGVEDVSSTHTPTA